MRVVIYRFFMICAIFACALVFLNQKECFAYSTQNVIKKTCKQQGILWALYYREARMGVGEKVIFNFNKQSDRKKVLWYSCFQDYSIDDEFDNIDYDLKLKKLDSRLRFKVSKRGRYKIMRISKWFFGTNTNIGKVFWQRHSEFFSPFLWKFHIIEKNGKIVKAKANYSWVNEREKKHFYCENPVCFTLERNKNGKYGYILKRISIWKKE